MIEWLIDHLKQFLNKKSNLSCYGLEYSTALFMNLCLHRSGKLRCLPMAQEVLSTFLDLLSSTNKRQVCMGFKKKKIKSRIWILVSNTRYFIEKNWILFWTVYSFATKRTLLSKNLNGISWHTSFKNRNFGQILGNFFNSNTKLYIRFYKNVDPILQ